MGEFTSHPGQWLAEAAEHSLVLMRHGRPVARLRPLAQAQRAARQSATSVDATHFARHARQVIDEVATRAQPQIVSRYGKPWVVVEPLRVKNFDGLVLASTLDELTAESSGKAVALEEFALSIDLDE